MLDKATVKNMMLILQVLNAYLLTNGESEGGDYFLGGKYSLAEVVASPHLKRMLVALPAMRDVDPLKLAAAEGLDRLAAWMKVGLKWQLLTIPLLIDLLLGLSRACALQACVSRPSVLSQVASDNQLLQAAEEISKE